MEEENKKRKTKVKRDGRKILTKILAALMAFFMVFAIVSTCIYYII